MGKFLGNLNEKVRNLTDWLYDVSQPGGRKSIDRIKTKPVSTSTSPDITRKIHHIKTGSSISGPDSPGSPNHAVDDGKDAAREPHMIPIEITCPECGAPLEIFENNYTATCEFCSSLLIVEKEGETLYFQVPNKINSGDDVIGTLADFYANRLYSELVARYRSSESGSGEVYSGTAVFTETIISEATRIQIEKKIRKFREQFLSSVQVDHAQCFYAPYWHIDGIVANAYLGREKHSGHKHLQPRFYQLEFTSPAYDEEKINLRDAGLRISGSKLTLLHRGEALHNFPYLEKKPFDETLFQQAEFWFNRIPWDNIQPIQNMARFLHKRARLVFKPFWIVKYRWEGNVYQHLLDGVFRSVAGNLVYEKDLKLASFIQENKPLYPEGDIDTTMIPSECPVCDNEQRYNPNECIHFCENCHRALEISDGAVREKTYYVLGNGLSGTSRDDIVFLPMWAFEVYITTGSSKETFNLSSYLKMTGEKVRGKPQCAEGENIVMVPALKYFAGKRPDEMFCSIVRDLTWAEKHIITDKVNLDVKARFLGATMTQKEAKGLIPFLIYSLLDKPTAMRMNKLTVKQYLENTTIHVDTSFLFLIPLKERDRQFINPLLTMGIPKTYLDGTWIKEWIRTAYFRKHK